MSESIGFLLARIAEDEAAARAATEGPWRYTPGKEWHTDPEMLRRAQSGLLTYDGEEFVGAGPTGATVCVAATGPSDDPQSVSDAQHIARHDPARVLAECEAKRRIVAEFAPFPSATQQQVYTSRLLFSLLALPYADHPDYDESWRP